MKKILLLLLSIICLGQVATQAQNIDSRWAYFINDGRYQSQAFYLPDAHAQTGMVVVQKNDPITWGLLSDNDSEFQAAIANYFFKHRKRATVFTFDGKQYERGSFMAALVEVNFFGMIWTSFDEDATLPRNFDAYYLVEFLTGRRAGVKAKEMEHYMRRKKQQVSFMGDPNAIYQECTLPFGDTPVGDQIHIPIDFTLKTYIFYDAKADKTVAVVFSQSCIDKVKLAEPSRRARFQAFVLSAMAAIDGREDTYMQMQERLARDECSDMIAPFIKNFKFKDRGAQGSSGSGGSGSGGGGGGGGGGEPEPEPQIGIALRPVRDSLSFPPSTTIGDPIDDLSETSRKKRKNWKINGLYARDIAESDAFTFLLADSRIVAIDKTTGHTQFLPGPQNFGLTTIAALPDNTVLGWVQNVGLVQCPTMEVVWKPVDPKANYDVRYDAKRERIVLEATKRVGGIGWVILLDKNLEEVVAYQATEIRSSVLTGKDQILISTASQMFHYQGEELISTWERGNTPHFKAMVEDSKGNLFGLSDKELWQIDPAGQKCTKLNSFYGLPLSLKSKEEDKPLSIAVDQADQLIVGCVRRTAISTAPHTNPTPRTLKNGDREWFYTHKLYVDQLGNWWLFSYNTSLVNETGIVGYGRNQGEIEMEHTYIPIPSKK